MITRRDLEKAVEELERSEPTYQNCQKLADLYVILDHLGKPMSYYKEGKASEFIKAVTGKDIKKVFLVMDELMEATQILSPKLYDNVMIRIKEI